MNENACLEDKKYFYILLHKRKNGTDDSKHLFFTPWIKTEERFDHERILMHSLCKEAFVDKEAFFETDTLLGNDF